MIPTSSTPIHLPDEHPRLTRKLAILRATNPALYTEITQRDAVTDMPVGGQV